jgi:hypothetical protein
MYKKTIFSKKYAENLKKISTRTVHSHLIRKKDKAIHFIQNFLFK